MKFRPRLSHPRLRGHWPLATVVALAIAGCGAGKPIEGGLTSPPASYTGIRLEPASVTLGANGTADFQAFAEFSDGSENAATNATFSATGGSIDADGHFTAGDATGAFRVIVSLLGASDTSEVVVASDPRALNAIILTPSQASAVPGGSAQFSAVGRLADGSDSTVPVVWSASGGTVNGSGLYTAPRQTGTFRVIAALSDGSLADTASVVVASVPPTLAGVLVTPPSANLLFGQTQQFVGSGRLSDGSATTVALTWTATGGTVNGSGLYTAGSTAGGNFRVIARAANGMADTSGIVITAPAITSLTMSPATVTLDIGSGTQFTLSARLSTGATTSNPTGITWSATGGTVTSSGVFTAGATAGNFQVIARAPSGVADTSAVAIVTPAPPTGGPTPNRPAGYVNSTSLDFSQAIPSLPDNVDRPIPGASPNWNMIYFGDSWSQMNDPTAAQSPPGVWKGTWSAGAYGGGVIGQGSGHGIGNVFTTEPRGVDHMYLSMRVYFDFDATQWHPISNKFVNIETDAGLLLVQLREGNFWRHAEELVNSGTSFWIDPGNLPGQVDNRVVPTRRWTQIEVLIDLPNRVFKIWQDGVITTSASPPFTARTLNGVGWNAFRGGGGETLATDLFWRYDDFLVAW